MLKFEWNALRTGDRVLVHDPGGGDLALTSGVVAHVEVHKGGNGVAIHVGAGGQNILWLSSLAVHPDPLDPTEPCWRCESLAKRAVPQPA